jgi:hypothetical protein
VRPSRSVLEEVQPEPPDIQALTVDPNDSVGYVLGQVACTTGIEDPLILVDYWGGQHWTLSTNQTMEEVVRRSRNTTFTYDFDDS